MSWCFAISLALTAPAEAPLPKAAQKELRALQGKWEVVRLATKDHEGDLDEGERYVLELKGRKWIFDGAVKAEITAIDPSTDPTCLDMKSLEKGDKGTVREAVYQIKGDTLRIALYQGKGEQRPTGFDKPTSSGTIVVTLKRLKEK